MGFYKWWRESQLSQDVRMLERVVSGKGASSSEVSPHITGPASLGGEGQAKHAADVEGKAWGAAVAPSARGNVR